MNGSYRKIWGCFPWTRLSIVGAAKNEDYSLTTLEVNLSNPTYIYRHGTLTLQIDGQTTLL